MMNLNNYETLRRQYDKQGITHAHMSLLKAFCIYLENAYSPLKDSSLQK